MSTKWLRARSVLTSSTLLITLAAGAPMSALAGASPAGSLVFDPTNYIQNSLTATQTLKQLESQIEQYAMQKYGINVNLQNLPQSAINDMIAKYPPKNRYELNYLDTLSSLEQQMHVSRMSVQQQYSAYTASGLTPGQYINQEQQLANSNQAYAASGYTQAKAAMKRTNDLAKAAQQEGKKIGHVKGAGHEMDLLNTQMHTLIQQNQVLLKMVSANEAAKSQQNSQKAIKQKHEAAINKKIKAYNDANNTTEKQFKSQLFSKLPKSFNYGGKTINGQNIHPGH